MDGLGLCFTTSSILPNSWLQWAPGQALGAVKLNSQLAFAWESPSSAQVAAISDCFTAQAGGPRQNISGGRPWPAPPRKLQG